MKRAFVAALVVLLAAGMLGFVPSRVPTARVAGSVEQFPPAPRIFAVVVGIGKYRSHQIPKLVSPSHDARAIAHALLGGSRNQTTLLIDAQATRQRIQSAVQTTAARMTPADYFLFYFSGHGGSEIDDATGQWLDYLQPANGSLSGYRNDIMNTDLFAWLRGFPNPHHIIIILDSCYSGGFFGGRSAKSHRQPFDRTAQFSDLHEIGCTVFSASDYNEISVDSDDGSLFTNDLVKGLEEDRDVADANHDHRIAAQELFDYAAPRTTAAAAEFKECEHPQFFAGDNPVLLEY